MAIDLTGGHAAIVTDRFSRRSYFPVEAVRLHFDCAAATFRVRCRFGIRESDASLGKVLSEVCDGRKGADSTNFYSAIDQRVHTSRDATNIAAITG